MSYINEISYYQNDRSEESNKRLASRIAKENLQDAITEISTYLFDKNKTIASDCIAVLYHVGYEKPEMIFDLTDDFHKLLTHKNNRMVWGGMIALSTISEVEPNIVEKYIKDILLTFEKGSLISQVWAYKTIANISRQDASYETYIPFLLDVLEKTRAVDFAKRATIVNEIIQNKDKKRFLEILINRSDLSKTATKVINKLIYSLQKDL